MTLKDPQATTETTEAQADDRRATIEAAFEAAAEPAPETKPVPGTAEKQTAENTTTPETTAQNVATEKTAPAEAAEKSAGDPTTDRPPQSWKPAEKAKWAQLDPDIRKEVLRREHEITRTLGDTAQARQFAQQFQQAVQPFMARIQAAGMQPVAMVQELLKADHLLSTAPKAQRAQFMAQLIADYDIDIQALDAALAGRPVADPVDARVEQLLQQRLAPFTSFIQQQQEQAQRAQAAEVATAAKTVEQMATDPKFPHFEAVRETMADLIEFYATKKNIFLEPEEAYNKAVMSDPTLSKQIQAQSLAATQTVQAQRAKNASVSVSGAPRAQMTGSPAATDRRAIIEQAFDQLASR